MKEEPKIGDYVYLTYGEYVDAKPHRYLVKITRASYKGNKWCFRGILLWLEDDDMSGLEVGHDNTESASSYHAYTNYSLYKSTTQIESILVLENL